jgi:hypothetical protein
MTKIGQYTLVEAADDCVSWSVAGETDYLSPHEMRQFLARETSEEIEAWATHAWELGNDQDSVDFIAFWQKIRQLY